MRRFFFTIPLLLMTVVLLAGCGDPDGQTGVAFKTHNDSNLKRLRSLFAAYYSAHETLPKSEAELRELVDSGGADQVLRFMGVSADEFDSLFISERDDQPFIVEYGVPFRSGERAVPMLVEQVGVDGIREGILTNGKVVELSTQDEVDDFLTRAKESKGEKGEEQEIEDDDSMEE